MTRKGGDLSVPSLLWSSPRLQRNIMETEMLGILLGIVLPLYPMLFAIYQKIGKYDEFVEEHRSV
jgi:hypothetical protein